MILKEYVSIYYNIFKGMSLSGKLWPIAHITISYYIPDVEYIQPALKTLLNKNKQKNNPKNKKNVGVCFFLFFFFSYFFFFYIIPRNNYNRSQIHLVPKLNDKKTNIQKKNT